VLPTMCGSGARAGGALGTGRALLWDVPCAAPGPDWRFLSEATWVPGGWLLVMNRVAGHRGRCLVCRGTGPLPPWEGAIDRE